MTRCLASPRWDALVVLVFGGIFMVLAYYYNLGNVSSKSASSHASSAQPFHASIRADMRM